MKFVARHLLLAGFVVSAGTPTYAEEPSGLYIGAAIAPNFPGGGSPSLSKTPAGIVTQSAGGFNTGLRGGVSLGWSFGDGLRAEIEGVVAGNNARATKTELSLTGGASQRGEAAAGVLANVFYDFTPPALRVGSVALPMEPYLGAGFGYVSVYRKNVPAVALSGSAATYNYTAGAPAGQFIAGLAIPLAAVRGLDLTLDYRLMDVAGSGHRTITATAGAVRQPLTFTSGSLTEQSVMLGVRYSFGG